MGLKVKHIVRDATSEESATRRKRYFVLNPKGGDASSEASRQAIRAYAAVIEPFDPEIASDLVKWAQAEQMKAKL